MVKKHVYVYAGPYDTEDDGPDRRATCARLRAENDELHAALVSCKTMITRQCTSRRWDCFKRIANPYELVHGPLSTAGLPGVTAHAPVSRSYFKMWEILCDLGHIIIPSEGRGGALIVAFIAEGPGGFVEAFAQWRGEERLAGDALHGITLSPHGARGVPGWRLESIGIGTRACMRVHSGVTGTGDLYCVENLDAFVRDVGEAACHLVTGDGGFDFSNDYNGQEMSALRLLVCEAYAALRVQRPGGSLVLKMYDLHASESIRLLYVLRSAYGAMRMVKPHASRPANSERYIVCTDFRGAQPQVMAALRSVCESGDTRRLLEGVVRVPSGFLRDVVVYNTYHIARQVACITHTLLLLSGQPPPASPHEPPAALLGRLCKALRWCHKYGVRVSADALRMYRPCLKDGRAPPPRHPAEEREGATVYKARAEAPARRGGDEVLRGL